MFIWPTSGLWCIFFFHIYISIYIYIYLVVGKPLDFRWNFLMAVWHGRLLGATRINVGMWSKPKSLKILLLVGAGHGRFFPDLSHTNKTAQFPVSSWPPGCWSLPKTKNQHGFFLWGKSSPESPIEIFRSKFRNRAFRWKMLPSSNSGLDWCLLPSGNQTWQLPACSIVL